MHNPTDEVAEYRKVLDGLRMIPTSEASHQQRLLQLLTADFAAPFEYLQDSHSDVDDAVALHRKLLDLSPRGHPDRASWLGSLANGLRVRFKQLTNRADLDEAILLRREALELCPNGYPAHTSSIEKLADDLHNRFKQFGDMSDLDEAIMLYQEALTLRPEGHLDRASSLNGLANGLRTRFTQLGDHPDLSMAIALLCEAFTVCPSGHPEYTNSLSNLASCLHLRFTSSGDYSDLDTAIVLHREALQLRLNGHPDRALSLNNLAVGLFTRFEQVGSRTDLDEAISLQREVLELCPSTHPDRALSLNNLAISIHTRFEQLGDRTDLDEAILLHRDALTLRPIGHPDFALSLNNLAIGIFARFEQFGDHSDLNEAITLHREAIGLRPTGHPDRMSSLNNLAISLCARFHELGDCKDLNEAVVLHHESLQLCPQGHPDRAMSLSNLANGLLTRFEQLGDPADLDEAIALHREVVGLRPTGQPNRALSLYNLAHVLHVHFEQFGKSIDLNEAVALYKASIEERADHWQSRWALAVIKSWPDFPYYNLTACLQLIQDLLDSPLASTQILLQGAMSVLSKLSTANTLDLASQRQIVQVYQHAISLMPKAAYLGLNLSQQLQSILDAEPAAILAASHALVLPEANISLALDLLESGRAVFWRQSLGLRSPLDDLDIPQDLHQRIIQLSQALMTQPSKDRIAAERENSVRWKLSLELNQLIQEVHKGETEEHKHFLLPEQYAILAKAAANGPVIVLLSTPLASGAMIVKTGGQNDWVPLPRATPQWLKDWNASWQREIGEARAYLRSCREEHASVQATSRTARLYRFREDEHELLARLWDCVVEPILSVLGMHKAQMKLPRLWWCPTGEFTFIPLHAAGLHPTGPCCSDHYISSYTPTLSALLRAQEHAQNPPPIQSASLVLAAVPCAADPMVANLPGTEREIKTIAELLCGKQPLVTNINRVKVVMNAKSTDLRETLPKADILHLASHGVQAETDPLQSGFLMADKKLSIQDLMALDLPNAFLAILSACHTAKGDTKQPDQTVHLAAAMLFAGFKSVIATMWEMQDSLGSDFAEKFYSSLFGGSTEHLSPDLIAAALHDTIESIRKPPSGEHPLPSVWAPFIHIGA